jgi:UDP-glucose 4-epimerase
VTVERKCIQPKFGNSLVTGGAGFIGSHLVDKLISEGHQVKVIDNLSSGEVSNLPGSRKNVQFFEKDLKTMEEDEDFMKDVETVFHMAANPEVRIGFQNPEISFNENILSTFKLLEIVRKNNVQNFVFASSSVVYGEPKVIPTKEDYAPLLPISPYAASKIACEAMISSYCYNYGINGTICRFANIVGQRSNHGVIFDFLKKLQQNNQMLEVLGDGTQSKSYMHIKDCIDGFIFCASLKKEKVGIFNMGNIDTTDVLSIADIVIDTMNLENVKIKTTGGVDGGRGWKGDVKQMHLDVSKLKDLGWLPKLSSNSAVRKDASEIFSDISATNE